MKTCADTLSSCLSRHTRTVRVRTPKVFSGCSQYSSEKDGERQRARGIVGASAAGYLPVVPACLPSLEERTVRCAEKRLPLQRASSPEAEACQTSKLSTVHTCSGACALRTYQSSPAAAVVLCAWRGGELTCLLACEQQRMREAHIWERGGWDWEVSGCGGGEAWLNLRGRLQRSAAIDLGRSNQRARPAGGWRWQKKEFKVKQEQMELWFLSSSK